MKNLCLFAACAAIASAPALAQDHSAHIGSHEHHDQHNHADHDLAPIGVMGSHIHDKGEWMVSYRYMHMNMEGNRNGTSDLSNDTIATTFANRFASIAGQPPTLRVVPTEMSMDMHMLGSMYGVTDWLTAMLMLNYIEKEMDHVTYQGGAGTTELGRFTTNSSGWGDARVGGLLALYEDDIHQVHANMMLSIPTGSIKETAKVLAPNGTTPILRMPYSMQLGTGTYDVHPGVTYSGFYNDWGWGAQAMAEIRLENENDQGYAWGDKYAVTAWGAYRWTQSVSTSLRLSASTQDSIDGIDSNIVAPVQTADPDNYGGEIVDLGIGLNFDGYKGVLKGHRIGFELTAPLYRDLNGPQLETDWSATLAWRKSF